MKRPLFFALVLSLSAAESISRANAQDLSSLAQQNMAFDQQFFGQLQGMQMQNQMRQQQLMQNYIAQNGPQLRAEYQQFVASTGMQIPFEQFVYSHIMTQGGRNAGPAACMQSSISNSRPWMSSPGSR